MHHPERIHLNKDPNMYRSTFNLQVLRGHILSLGFHYFSFIVYFTEIMYEKNAHSHYK